METSKRPKVKLRLVHPAKQQSRIRKVLKSVGTWLAISFGIGLIVAEHVQAKSKQERTVRLKDRIRAPAGEDDQLDC